LSFEILGNQIEGKEDVGSGRVESLSASDRPNVGGLKGEEKEESLS